VDATSASSEAVVGDECHIVSGQTNGPRYESQFPSDRLDALDNLILLCRVHHKVVDDQAATYVVDRLKRLKADHERWVTETLGRARSMRLRRWAAAVVPVLLVLGGVTWLPERLWFPVAMKYVGQVESQAGYVLQLRISSTRPDTVYVPVQSFQVKITHDEGLLRGMAPAERARLVFGESVTVFTSQAVLDTAIGGRSYANADTHVACGPEPRNVFLLVTVQGPNSPNPSARLQLGAVYRGVKVSLRRGLWTREYLDVPIRHVPLLAGDDKTRVIER
jgi:hypothetical protein